LIDCGGGTLLFAMSIAALAFGARWLWRWDVAAT
jgi:hypothetical protein